VDSADWSTATVRNASRMARRMASRRANVNDIFASCLPVHDIGEGHLPDTHASDSLAERLAVDRVAIAQ